MSQFPGFMLYQVGGSLTSDAPSYIDRQADIDLYAALQRGEFCYVLNSRQMGKSSLLVKTRNRLQQIGYRCIVVDMTNIGSENITPLQWYKGVVKDLWRGFKLMKQVDLQTWWEDESDISLLQRLSRFISDVLLKSFPNEHIVIFIDEIDSILSLPFSVDDFFALIRFCYNQRAIDSEYKRISFALFGVATPADLIQDRTRTPFNLGTAIALDGFTAVEAQPLLQGITAQLPNAPVILQAILDWTNGQPFLTQKLCQSAVNASQASIQNKLTIPLGTERYWIDNLVQTTILNQWESQDEPEHLRTIRNRILNNQDTAGRLLGMYQQILEGGEGTPRLPVDDSPEQVELILSGLVIKQDNYLRVKNRIYAAVFNLAWVEQQLKQLRPYSQTLLPWVESQRQDESRLLRGQALQDAQEWSQGKRLSDLDYQFLAASVESDRRQVQQALEADRIQAVEAQLAQEQRSSKLQRQLLGTVGAALLIAIGFGTMSFLQYRQARISEIKALTSSAEGNFDSHRQLEAMVQAIAANRKLNDTKVNDPVLQERVKAVLLRIIDGITTKNQLSVGAGIQEVAMSPDGQTIAAGIVDGSLRLWQANGQLLKTWNAHTAAIGTVEWSRDGQMIMTASGDKTVKFWRADGTLLHSFPFEYPVRQARLSPDGQKLAVTTSGQKGYLLNQHGKLIKQIQQIEQIQFSPNSQFLIALMSPPPLPPRTRKLTEGDQMPRFSDPPPNPRKLKFAEANQIERPSPINTQIIQASNGEVIREFATEKGPIFAITTSPDSQTFATASVDGNVSIWNIDGELLKTFVGHNSNVRSIAFSPDGSQLATASTDNTIRLWQTEGSLLKVFSGHQARVRTVVFNPNGQSFVSGGEDGMVKIWQTQHPYWQVLASHSDTVTRLAFTPNGQYLLSAAVDFRLNFWRWRQQQEQALNPVPEKSQFTPVSISGLAVSPDAAQIAMTFREGLVEIRNADGTVQQSFQLPNGLRDIAFSPNNQQLIAGGSDGAVKLWQRSIDRLFPEQPTQSLVGHQGAINAVAFSTDGKLFASAAFDKTIKLWQPDGQLLQTLTGHQAGINALAFSPQENLLASASSDNTVKLWQPDGRLVSTLTGHRASVLDVAFSPDGQSVVSASVDGTVKVWQAYSGKLLRTLAGHTGAVEAVTFSPDGKSIVSTSLDRRIIIWSWPDIHQLNELDFACAWLRDYLQTYPATIAEHQSICPSN